jgi:transcriptional regulator with XRE-family HTH domain
MSPDQSQKSGIVYVTLKAHLTNLEEIESTKPPTERRDVPSMAQLAQLAGVTPNTIARWARNEIESTTHRTLARIISELRARGFDTNLTDILAYREDD